VGRRQEEAEAALFRAFISDDALPGETIPVLPVTTSSC
jgi:hypothetical protein